MSVHRFTIGDTVKHSGYVIQRARDYWLSCGREPMKSGAKADLDKKLRARGTVESVRTNPDAVFVRWNDGHTSDCLAYMVARIEIDRAKEKQIERKQKESI